MMMKRADCYTLLIGCLLLLAAGAVHADNEDQTFRTAVYLLDESTQVARDGRHHQLLRALRHLQDPQLQPLFEELVDSPQPVLQIHGMLGLAESDPQRKLDLVRIAAMTDPAAQAQVITAAMDSNLLTEEQARQLINWDGLDIAIKVLVSAQLVQHGQFDKIELLKEAAGSDNLARQGMASLLLLQLGDRAGLAGLQALRQSSDLRRDDVIDVVLQSALRYELDQAGGWAMEVATEPGLSSRVTLQALHVALRFKTPGAAAVWRQQYDSTGDLAARTRLALLALRLAPHLEPKLFDPLIATDDAVIGQIGRTGAAVATGHAVADEVVKLIELNHPIANGWALSFARDDATDEQATAILLKLVAAFEEGPARNRARRLDDAVTASQLLFDANPEAGRRLLGPIVGAPDVDPLLVQGVLLGLIRSQQPGADLVLEGLEPFGDLRSRQLAALLRARHGRALSAQEMADLSLLIRGGGAAQDALRVQAAWFYLKLTDRVQPALAEVVGQRF